MSSSCQFFFVKGQQLGNLPDESQEAWSLDTGVKQGYVKEYVEKNGLGMIFSQESGLILFSDKHVYSGKSLPQ